MKIHIYTLLVILLGTVALNAQSNNSYAVTGYAETFNTNIERVGIGTYNLSHAFGSIGNIQSYLSQHTNGTANWSIIINAQPFDVAVSDQLVLPSGELALSGIYGDINSGYYPFIARVSPNGNIVSAMGYQGLPLPFSTVHKIAYDEASDHLFICGSNRIADPFQTTYSPHQEAFVISVEASSLSIVNWCSVFDSGPAVANDDFDIIDEILVVGQGVFVTGSSNDPASGDQVIMFAMLDINQGGSYYANSLRLGAAFRGCGASVIQTDPSGYQVLVMANTSAGIGFICVDTNHGTVSGSYLDNTPIPYANTSFQGYKMTGNGFDQAITIVGYLLDNTAAPVPNPVLSTFFYQVEMPGECSIVPYPEGFYFPANNSGGPKYYYGSTSTIDFISTPDMAYRDNDDLLLVGYTDDGIEVNVFDNSQYCKNACVEVIRPSLTAVSYTGITTLNFNPIMASPTGVPLKRTHVTDVLITTCEPNISCPADCPVLISPNCGIDYLLSAGGCIDPCLNPQYTWTIPSLGVFQEVGEDIIVQSFGNNHSYTLEVTFTNPDGTRSTCIYQNELSFPDFDCSQVQIDVQTTLLGGTQYQTTVNITPSCLPTSLFFNICLDGTNCCASTNNTANSVIWDAATCGPGTYKITGLVDILSATSLKTCAINETYKVLCEDKPVVKYEHKSGFHFSCGFASPGYIEYRVYAPLGSCYQYSWNIPGNPFSQTGQGVTFISCNTTPPHTNGNMALTITNTCTGCVMSTTDVREWFPPANQWLTDGSSNKEEALNAGPFLAKNSGSRTTAAAFDITVSPNPSSGLLQLSFENKQIDELAAIEVYNSSGQLVHQQQVELVAGAKNSLRLDLTDQPAGVYFIHYNSDTGNLAKPLVLMK